MVRMLYKYDFWCELVVFVVKKVKKKSYSRKCWFFGRDDGVGGDGDDGGSDGGGVGSDSSGGSVGGGEGGGGGGGISDSDIISITLF